MITVLAVCFGLRAEGVVTADTWFNLRFGREILAHGLPHHNTDTLLGLGEPWIDVQWLAHCIWYGVYRLGNLTGVVAVRAVLIGVALLIPIWGSRSSSLRPALVVLLAAIVAAPFFAARAQSFAEVYASIALFILRSGLTPKRRAALIALGLLWANTHGSAPLLAGMIALFTLVEPKDRKANSALFVGTLLCLLATPYGFATASHFRGTLFNPLLRKWVEEWSFASVRETPGFFLAMLLTLGVIVRARAWRLDRFGVGLCGATALLGLWANRHQVFFALALAHFGVAWVDHALKTQLPFAVRNFKRRPVTVLVGLCMVGSVWLCHRATIARRTDGFAQTIPILKTAIANHAQVFIDLSLSDRLLFEAPELAGKIPFDVRLELWDDRTFAWTRLLERDHSALGLRRWEGYDFVWFERREEYQWQLAQLSLSSRWIVVSSTRIEKVFLKLTSRSMLAIGAP